MVVRFFVVESTHPGLYLRFGISVVYLSLIILSVRSDVPVDSKVPTVTS
jgi:hypothetical protein